MQRIQEQTTENYNANDLFAAIDLGSNSFHMIVAKIDNSELRPIERVAEKIQLAQGLENGYLSEESIERGLHCLKRFKQVIDSLGPRHVRIIGTNTLRAAKNAKEFNRKAEKILKQKIQIVAGREEARLVYLGVSHTLADDDTPRLVIDIGGGSTEFIIGQQFEAKQCESLHMGCVSYTKRFFQNEQISASMFEAAYEAACLEVLRIKDGYDKRWQECVGSSGTFKALNIISEINSWSDEGITKASLKAIRDKLIKAGNVNTIKLNGLKENRRGVISAGCAIALAIFDTLNIKKMRHSTGALREGVIYDTLGRFNHEDVRERTVTALETRYNVNTPNLDAILHRCGKLFEDLEMTWELDKDNRQYLFWAARLHEIGQTIAHTQYHRHGHYLLENSDLPGFSKQEQLILALLVRGHRRKLPVADYEKAGFNKLMHLTVILRIAIALKYAEIVEPVPVVRAKAYKKGLKLNMPNDWLDAHPLTASALLMEQRYLQLADFELILNGH